MARYDNMTHSLMPYDRRHVVLATERTPCRPVKAQVRNYVERARAYLLAVPFPTHFILSVSLQVMSSQAFCPFFHCRYLFSPSLCLFFRWRYLSLFLMCRGSWGRSPADQMRSRACTDRSRRWKRRRKGAAFSELHLHVRRRPACPTVVDRVGSSRAPVPSPAGMPSATPFCES